MTLKRAASIATKSTNLIVIQHKIPIGLGKIADLVPCERKSTRIISKHHKSHKRAAR
jgi:hypothetical protein